MRNWSIYKQLVFITLVPVLLISLALSVVNYRELNTIYLHSNGQKQNNLREYTKVLLLPTSENVVSQLGGLQKQFDYELRRWQDTKAFSINHMRCAVRVPNSAKAFTRLNEQLQVELPVASMKDKEWEFVQAIDKSLWAYMKVQQGDSSLFIGLRLSSIENELRYLAHMLATASSNIPEIASIIWNLNTPSDSVWVEREGYTLEHPVQEKADKASKYYTIFIAGEQNFRIYATLGVDYSAKADAMSDFIRNQAWTILVIVFITIGLSFYMSKRFVKPIDALVSVVRAIEKGHYRMRFSINGNKEIAYLSDKINRMAGTIEQNQERLEQTVTLRTETIARKNEELEKQKHEMLAGIRAAERLQKLILPQEVELQTMSRSTFIVNMPKDYVSGDFYWAARIGSLSIVALGDCTGHGISGAILSILGNEILNRVVHEQHLTIPGEILSAVDSGLRHIIHHNREAHYKDGMDVTVCAFNHQSLEMKYASANSRFFLYRNKEVEELRGDKRSIGDTIEHSPSIHFTTHSHQLQKGDMIYLSSDGYADQFGGTSNKKYTRKKLREQFSKVGHLPSLLQKLLIIKQFNEWKGANFQVDDVLVIGIRI